MVHTVSGFQYHYGKQIKTSLFTKNKQDLILVHDAQKLSFDDLSALSTLTKEGCGKLVLLNNAAATHGFRAGNPIKLLKEQGITSYQSLKTPIKGTLKLSIARDPSESMLQEWLQLSSDQQQKHTVVALNNKQKEEFTAQIRKGLLQQGQLSRQEKKSSGAHFCIDDCRRKKIP